MSLFSPFSLKKSPKRVFEGIKLKSNQNLRKNYIQNFFHMYFDNQICINQKFHPVQNSKIREIQMSKEKRVGCGKPIKRPNSLTSWQHMGPFFAKFVKCCSETGTKNRKYNIMSTVKATTWNFLWKKIEIITRLCIEHWMGYVRGWYGWKTS